MLRLGWNAALRVWRRDDEEFQPDCINYKKHETGTRMMFWGAFRWERIGPGVFFEPEKGKKVNSTVYRDQILTGLLQKFWEKSFEELDVPIVMEDNAPPHKKVCISVRQELGEWCATNTLQILLISIQLRTFGRI